MTLPLMPRATAVWLIDNTSLSFEQIAEFCGMHILEVKGIADGEVAVNIKGMNPIKHGQLTKEEIERCEVDKEARLRLTSAIRNTVESNKALTKKTVKYTPIARRENKPNAIAWLLKNCPEMSDKQISKLVGSTTPTVTSIRNKTHWNMSHISPKDPILLGMCTRHDLEEQLEKARALNEEADKK